MTDPMKDLVRHYDRLVVQKGGTSIFRHKPAERATPLYGAPQRFDTKEPMSPEDYRTWRENRAAAKHAKSERARGNRYRHESVVPKPGRLVAGLMGKLGGYMDDLP